jgi:hypothetical protein
MNFSRDKSRIYIIFRDTQSILSTFLGNMMQETDAATASAAVDVRAIKKLSRAVPVTNHTWFDYSITDVRHTRTTQPVGVLFSDERGARLSQTPAHTCCLCWFSAALARAAMRRRVTAAHAAHCSARKRRAWRAGTW